MTTKQPGTAATASRRLFLQQAALLGAGAAAAPYVLRHAHAARANLGPLGSAKIDCRQAAGEQISVLIIPACFFDNLISVTPEFEALTGIKDRYDKVPPGH